MKKIAFWLALNRDYKLSLFVIYKPTPKNKSDPTEKWVQKKKEFSKLLRRLQV